MAANMRVILIFLAICMVNLYSAQPNGTETTTETISTTTESATTTEPTPVEENTDYAQCTCDLTANGCDINCCCDADCSADDKLAFSQCADQYNTVDSQACIRRDLLFQDNSPYTVDTTVPGLFCVQFDNYEARNYFVPPVLTSTEEKYDEYLAEYGPDYSFKRASADEETVNTDYYRSGDPIYTVYESNALGLLGLPAPFVSQYCADNNPAAYLYSQNVECVRPLSDLQTDCESSAPLSALTYYTGFRVITSLEAFQNLQNNDTNTSENGTVTDPPPLEDADQLYNTTFSTEVVPSGPHTCMDAAGYNATCWFGDVPPPPSYDAATGVCSNAVIKTTYTFTYNGTQGITMVTVTFTLANLTDAALPLTQGYQTMFRKDDDNATFVKSGNPGYRNGEPLLAGFLAERTNEEGETILGIELDTNRDNWITMVTSSATGNCESDLDNRVSVTFGLGMRSGCFTTVYFSNMTSACGQIQQAAWEALRGPNPPQYVATFGNTPVESVGDWVEILGVNDPPPTPSSSQTPGICRNIVTGLHTEFIYADVGSLANPQAKILGASYRYTTQDELRYQCLGAACMPGNDASPQRVEITSSVGFIDASTVPGPVSAEKPQVTARLPEDFFYPFS